MAPSCSRRGTPPALAALLLSLGAALSTLAGVHAALKIDSGTDINRGDLMSPLRGELMNRKFYYEVPHDPVGVLVMAHGCVHDAADFWPPGATCEECSGLPEEVAHTKQALARGYAVLAIDSKNRDFNNRCFSYGEDKWGFKYILENWTREKGLDKLPIFALGVSAGASFVLKLPKITRINGIISEVLGVQQESFTTPALLEETYPPTVFLDMQRDSSMTQRIAESVTVLRTLGVPAACIPVDSRPVRHSFFSDRSEFITPELSRQIVNGLREIGMLDYQGFVTSDPRYTTQPWRDQLLEILPTLRPETGAMQGLASDAAMISEQMNLAFASHEIISDHPTACLAWLEGQGSRGIDVYMQELRIKGRLSALDPSRQAHPDMQDDKALKEAAKQVGEQLAVTRDDRDNWGDIYASYVAWLKAHPAANVTFPAWRASKESGRFRYDEDDAAQDPVAAAELAKTTAAEAEAAEQMARQAAAAVRAPGTGLEAREVAKAARVAAERARARADAVAALAVAEAQANAQAATR
ncbi:hypothetical protein C2E20_1341 [Micractinium conductrix]|uniref:Uncharacterized protein n=1 Tax=Micractinium conductrix TaxID=554055 RepID=A0A2P6VN89_9CHLO|nr:hypothetical protein C2E20_1341 [Micractinium conductrix]|eukprot:PSC75566.1 hypothetical protein C2E20_1341 [Micractinium conductrix]